MEFNERDLIEFYAGEVFWLVVKVDNVEKELTVIPWAGFNVDEKTVPFKDVMNRWVEKPL